MYDLVVIGAGPGGYEAALEAAKLGMKTAVVENREVGGTCLNRGCVPAKALLHAAELYRNVQNGERFGIISTDVACDYEKINFYKEEASKTLREGIEHLLKANKVDLIRGTGIIVGSGKIKVTRDKKTEDIDAEKILIAAGSKPASLPIPGIDIPDIMTSDDMFRMEQIPKKLVIIGGGVIGVEFAMVFSSFGTKVTIAEAEKSILPGMDSDISKNLKILLKKRGVEIHTDTFVQKIEKKDQGFLCSYLEKSKKGDKTGEIETPYLLLAAGRTPNTDGLFNEGVTPETKRGRILVNQEFETSLPGVYAIGDVTGGTMLAHVASAQGVCAVELMNKKEPSIDLAVVPSCVYTDPEIACVGITEQEAKEKGIDAFSGKALTHSNCKSVITKEERGFAKIVIDRETDYVIGAQIMCARATDMIGEMGTAIANHMTVKQLMRAMRAHPTYNELIGEALKISAEAQVDRNTSIRK
ncbi:dihydrolipoyl dehydrogenase [Blautia liquoris]|uniref:Dihydrolipoyl dehydrogenase n=1 Tax=Blautia liquoris TaxID=2779518 RepID=A0A7M2RDM7_9FIRM|nr:dihydrolipoyl dehydrogenase [Blautia liquoris]QOV18396.1 dihydrolipoyl dehydrogenase [Blautia liquoris]